MYICLGNLSANAIYDLCQLINAIESAEYFTLKILKINWFREDGEVGKVRKEEKNSFILQKAITKNICDLLKWKSLKNFH